MWDSPNDFHLFFRCTNQEFGGKLLDRGSIKFNSPQSWVDEENEGGKGRGDRLEGVFAACSCWDIDEVLYNSCKYPDVYGETIGGLTYFRRKRTMELPCYCLFAVFNKLFDAPKRSGKQTVSAEIDGRYFRDFSDNRSPTEVLELSENKKPALVIITDMDKFRKMIKVKLTSMGVKDSEILEEQVEYCNKGCDFYCKTYSPRELRLKDQSFAYQSEIRIIVDTDNDIIRNDLLNNPIEIGAISSIAKKVDGYFPDGIRLNMDICASAGRE